MTSSAFADQKPSVINLQKATVIGGAGFDRVMALLGPWFVSGIFADGWAHKHWYTDSLIE